MVVRMRHSDGSWVDTRLTGGTQGERDGEARARFGGVE